MKGPPVWISGRNIKSALLTPIGVLITGAMTVAGWGGELSSPTGGNGLAQPALPPSVFDGISSYGGELSSPTGGNGLAQPALPPSVFDGISSYGGELSSPTGGNGLAQPALPPSVFDGISSYYSKPWTDFSRNTFAPPSGAPAVGNRLNFDLKTDYEVDIEKFLPADTFLQQGFLGNLQNGGQQKRKLPFMGFSIGKPLN